MKSKIILPFLVLLIFSSCSNKQEASIAKEEKNIFVGTVDAVEKDFIPELSLSGNATANREANLGAVIPGRLEKIYFNEGALVQKGSLIAELSGELLTMAEIEYQTLNIDFEKVARLKEKGSVTERDFDHIKAKTDAAKAKMNLLKKNTEIRAPFTGIVVEYLVQEGENYFFSPGLDPGYSHVSGIVRLMQLNPIKIKVDVNEKQISALQKGLTANFSFESYPETPFYGKLTNILPTLSTTTRSATVEFEIPNVDLKIKPGMFCHANIQLAPTKGVFIPLNSISRQAGTGEEFVYIVDNQIARRVPIQRIMLIDDQAVVSGLIAGQKVINIGKSKVSDGSKVVVNN